MSFLLCVATTFGVLGPEFLQLLYFMAHAQAEVIITNHHPDADFKQMVGTCFGLPVMLILERLCRGVWGFGRSPTLGMAFVIVQIHTAAFSAFVEQDLHMLDGGSGVDLHAMADELIASVP